MAVVFGLAIGIRVRDMEVLLNYALFLQLCTCVRVMCFTNTDCFLHKFCHVIVNLIRVITTTITCMHFFSTGLMAPHAYRPLYCWPLPSPLHWARLVINNINNSVVICSKLSVKREPSKRIIHAQMKQQSSAMAWCTAHATKNHNTSTSICWSYK
jgi:hypothetical protein